MDVPNGMKNLCQDRYAKAMEAKVMFLELLNAPIEFIAVENPTPLKVVELPKNIAKRYSRMNMDTK